MLLSIRSHGSRIETSSRTFGGSRSSWIRRWFRRLCWDECCAVVVLLCCCCCGTANGQFSTEVPAWAIYRVQGGQVLGHSDYPPPAPPARCWCRFWIDLIGERVACSPPRLPFCHVRPCSPCSTVFLCSSASQPKKHTVVVIKR